MSKWKKEKRRRQKGKLERMTGRAVRVLKSTSKFLKKNWLTVLGILIPIIASFVIYHLSYLEPDIRFTGTFRAGKEIDSRVRDNKFGLNYQKALFRFKNFSLKTGFVDRVEFIPASLSPNLTVTVLEIDKTRIGWREEKEIEIKWIVSVDVPGASEEYDQGMQSIIVNAKFYDNTGRQIPDPHGHFEFLQVAAETKDILIPQPQPSK